MHNIPLLTLAGVTMTRDGRNILENIDLTVGAGEIVTLIGQNGAGKSTLAKVALGLLRPDRGTVTPKPDLRIGYQPQRLNIDRSLPLSVKRFLTLTQRASDSTLRDVLDQVGMADFFDDSVHNLSGGELQRVMLARALLRRPELLVLDEPTQNVDMAGAVELYKLIVRLRDTTGCGVLLVSHDLNVVMAQTTRVYCLNGHVCCSGRPADVSRDPEFQRLFGPAAVEMLAIYPHAHDHVHRPGEHHHHHDHAQHDDGHHHA